VPKIAITFGILLCVLGVGAFIGTGAKAPTALIPAYFGAPIILCGVIATRPSLRMHAMHAAVLIGLVGVIGSAMRVIKGLTGGITLPVAFACQLIMLVLTGVFVALCVKSFIAARRSRLADAQ
jgi:hypothetical protein